MDKSCTIWNQKVLTWLENSDSKGIASASSEITTNLHNIDDQTDNNENIENLSVAMTDQHYSQLLEHEIEHNIDTLITNKTNSQLNSSEEEISCDSENIPLAQLKNKQSVPNTDALPHSTDDGKSYILLS